MIKYSVALLSYKHSLFLEKALDGIFSQNHSCDVVIVDDASPDNSVEIIEKDPRVGESRVRFLKHRVNRGLVNSLAEAFAGCQGDYVILCASDDFSEPMRVKVIAQNIESHATFVGGGFTGVYDIDVSGNRTGLSSTDITHGSYSAISIARNFRGCIGASSFYHKRVFNDFKLIDSGVIHEDMVLNFRAALIGEVVYIPDQLVGYRRHEGSTHGIQQRGDFEGQMRHVKRIYHSLWRVAFQRCVDVNSHKKTTGIFDKNIFRDCLKWRLTNLLKYRIARGRIDWGIILLSFAKKRVFISPIIKALIVRPKIAVLTCYYRLFSS